ncbi:MAG TPA: biopolymer transporter ExbD [Steroidobacteraceae bacterium]|nr:biopolymer transporter ExbD [Steroidobacteraceae bacterium]
MNLRPRTPPPDPEITVISMIDVVLLLLIFFMLSTTFVDEAKVKIQLPAASQEADRNTPRDRIEVTVTAQGSYRVNGKTLLNTSPQTLSAAISRAAGESRAVPVTVRADARTTHQSVVTAMDVLARLGFRSINIATVNESDLAGTKQR